MLHGDLAEFGLATVLELLAGHAKTGRLRLDDGARSGQIDLDGGRVALATADRHHHGLVRRLLELDVVAPRSVLDALDAGPADDATLLQRLRGTGAWRPEEHAGLLAGELARQLAGWLDAEQGEFVFAAADVPAPLGQVWPVGEALSLAAQARAADQERARALDRLSRADEAEPASHEPQAAAEVAPQPPAPSPQEPVHASQSTVPLAASAEPLPAPDVDPRTVHRLIDGVGSL